MKQLGEKKISLLYLIAFAVLVIVLIFFYYNTRKVKESHALIQHSEEVLRKSDAVLMDILNLESGARGYIITGDSTFLKPYSGSVTMLPKDIENLRSSTDSNFVQRRQIDSLQLFAEERIAVAQLLVSKFPDKQYSEAELLAGITKGKAITDKIRRAIANFNADEVKLLEKQRADNQSNNRNYNWIFLLLSFLILAVLLLLFLVFKSRKARDKESALFAASEKLLSNYSLSLIEASRDPLFTISTMGKITDTNEASAIVTGFSRQQLIGTDFTGYFTEPEKARLGYQQVFDMGFVADYPLTIMDGKLTDVLFNGSVYKDASGNVLGAVVVARDITEQKRIEKELLETIVIAELATAIAEEAKLKAEMAVKSKQQFLSNMSHEIRTPMNAIIGFTKVLLKTELSAKQREYLVAIKMSGDALIVLINDILDLAKVDAGKMMFEQIPFKIASSIAAMLHLFESKIEEKNISLLKEYDKNIPNVLLGDPVRLHQIISNLLSNAIKFTAAGRITVKTVLMADDNESVTIQIIITDTGIGIAQDKLASVFDNFQQASSGTSRLYGGTGLGLSIVKQLVEGQGGSIAVKSSIGEGSEFSFTMNFQKTDEQVAEDSGFAQLEEGIKNIKVLVVEDIALNQLLMKTLLDDFGFERDIAANGKIAIERMAEKNYDIILMDLQMPEMNGFEATEYIRNTLKSSIPIVALTADVTTVDLAKCRAVGMNDYISKPVDERLLYSKIINLVKRSFPNGFKDTQIIPVNGTAIKCIDLEYLLHRTKSDPALMMEMISLYLEQTPPLVDAMKKSFDKKDWTGLQAAVHKIIPSFSIMGISNDFELMAKKVQEYARERQHDEGMPDLLLKLENICIQACNELTIEFNTLKNTVK
jgi:PAS domain S-box-containing protein